jgi:hypothetical protein
VVAGPITAKIFVILWSTTSKKQQAAKRVKEKPAEGRRNHAKKKPRQGNGKNQPARLSWMHTHEG